MPKNNDPNQESFFDSGDFKGPRQKGQRRKEWAAQQPSAPGYNMPEQPQGEAEQQVMGLPGVNALGARPASSPGRIAAYQRGRQAAQSGQPYAASRGWSAPTKGPRVGDIYGQAKAGQWMAKQPTWVQAGLGAAQQHKQGGLTPPVSYSGAAGKAAVAYEIGKAAITPTRFTNPDTWVNRRLSAEGKSVLMGRGMGGPGIPQINTNREYLNAPRDPDSPLSGLDTNFTKEHPGSVGGPDPFRHYGTYGADAMVASRHAGRSSVGGRHAPGSGGPPPQAFGNPSSPDWFFGQNTSGTGSAFWDIHTQNTSGLNLPNFSQQKGR